MRVLMTMLAVVLFTAAIFINCGSIIHGSKQDISFETSPDGAWVEVSDAMGISYGDCETPCTIELKRKREYHVQITKSGYASADFIIKRKTSGWIWGNILFGGVIGLVIDFTNGSAYKLAPDLLQVTLSKGEADASMPERGDDVIVILDIEKLNPAQRAMISGLEPIPLSSLR